MSTQTHTRTVSPSDQTPTQSTPVSESTEVDNSLRQAQLASRTSDDAAGPEKKGKKVKRGGGTYTIKEGNHLQSIALKQIGHRRYWPQVRDANKKAVWSSDQMMVGDTLTIPELETPEDLHSGGAVPKGGTRQALYPQKHITDQGIVEVWPKGYPGTIPASGDGVLRMSAPAYNAFKLGMSLAGAAQQVAATLVVDNLLSYELFLDWVITDEEAVKAIATLAALPFSQIKPALKRLGPVMWGRLIENLPEGNKSGASWAKVRTAYGPAGLNDTDVKLFFDLLPDSELLALHQLMSWRFNLKVDGREGNIWDAAGLRRAWGILEQLPPGHVEDNDMLDMLLRDRAADGSGYYRSRDDSAVVGYGSDLSKTGSYGRVMVDDPKKPGGRIDVGLGSKVNLFNTVVRHEIGHAVDAKIGASKGYATTAPNAGKWKEYSSKAQFIEAIIAGGNMSGHGYDNEAGYEKALRRAVMQNEDFNDALKKLQDKGDVDKKVKPATASVKGPVAAVFTQSLWRSTSSPWYSKKDLASVGGRRFHQAYSSKYVSYEGSARTKFGISGYQWRAPGEWFAEAYACYYSDHDSTTNKQPGTRLRTRDSATANWFDSAVDKGHSLAKSTKQEGDSSTSDSEPAE